MATAIPVLMRDSDEEEGDDDETAAATHDGDDPSRTRMIKFPYRMHTSPTVG
jgi:hypothetical protein